MKRKRYNTIGVRTPLLRGRSPVISPLHNGDSLAKCLENETDCDEVIEDSVSKRLPVKFPNAAVLTEIKLICYLGLISLSNS